jgi:hypothetical protein
MLYLKKPVRHQSLPEKKPRILMKNARIQEIGEYHRILIVFIQGNSCRDIGSQFYFNRK